jgi:sodium-dependent dicarboxylate transporter 2/3/5
MARAGILINFIGVVVIAVVFYLLGMPVFSIEPGVLPDWATVAVDSIR